MEISGWCSFTMICKLFQIVQQRMSRQTIEKESSHQGGTSTDKLGRDNCFSTDWVARSDRRWQGLGWAYCKLQYKNFVYHYLVGARVRVSIRKTLCDTYTTWKESHYVSVPDNLPKEHNDSASSSSQKVCTNSNNVCLAAQCTNLSCKEVLLVDSCSVVWVIYEYLQEDILKYCGLKVQSA